MPSSRQAGLNTPLHLQENFELTHETLYLAVKLMDHYLVQVGAMRDKLQLIGSTAILIASKFEVSPHSSGSGEALSSLGDLEWWRGVCFHVTREAQRGEDTFPSFWIRLSKGVWSPLSLLQAPQTCLSELGTCFGATTS